MKIIYLHQFFNTPSMSGGTRSFEIARRLVDEGHEVHMITTWREAGRERTWLYSNEEGIHVHWLPVSYSNKMSFKQRVFSFLYFSISATFKAISIRADIVFATSTPLTIAIPAIICKWYNRIPMVFEVRDLWPELPIAMKSLKNPLTRIGAKKLELFAYKNSSSIIALSPGMKEGVASSGYPESNIAVIPNFSNIKLFTFEASSKSSFRDRRKFIGTRPLLIYTGTLGIINGVGYLVNLAVELQKINSDICILIIGDGAEFSKINSLAKKKRVLLKNIFIESRLPKLEIPLALSAATMTTSLFIDIPEMRSNSANKFFDSLAAGKPIFINYGGWMHNIIEHSKCGLSGWQKPLDLVAKELQDKMHDKEWLGQASASANNLAKNVFNRDILAEKVLSVLEETAAGNPEKAQLIAPNHYDSTFPYIIEQKQSI